MKKSVFVALPLALIVSACSTTYAPKTDYSNSYNFAEVDSFAVIGDEHIKNPLLSDIDRSRLNNAIEDSLEQAGIEEASENEADVLVSYFVVTKDKTKVYSTHTGGYYGRYGYSAADSQQIHTRNYVEGTLIVDVIDRESMQSVWRSTLQKPIKHYDNTAEREAAINQAISSMMSTMPAA
ncbi:DUF4136 domain-containing protein [Thalassotalea euphylliae]|uniref:DUF4136 domain-containing protein n=1 Tax=Thalassotalea euphylliae TaxID=1655234 RepID=UPI0036297A9B